MKNGMIHNVALSLGKQQNIDGNKLRIAIRNNRWIYSIYFNLRLDIIVVLFSKRWRQSIDNALELFLTKQELKDQLYVKKVRKDILFCYCQIMSTPMEYFLLDLQNKSKKQRITYLTDKYMNISLTKLGLRDIHDSELTDKYKFYLLTAPYFHRKLIEISKKNDYEEFVNFTNDIKKVIIKPNMGSCGRGIFISEINSKDDAIIIFNELLKKGGRWIIEELIKQSQEMSSWNKSSVNTIRILTFLNENNFSIITPFFRVGRKNSIVDNAGSGGLFANIDYKTGLIYTDAIDETGKYYTHHPDSGLKFKGYRLPRWNELLSLVEDIHRNCMPLHKYIGWDFALSDDGWVLIEGNWGQFVNQYNDKIGRKKEFLTYIGI